MAEHPEGPSYDPNRKVGTQGDGDRDREREI
jgi:hypothetical protein